MAQMIHYHFTDTFSFSDIAAIDSSGILFSNGLSIFFEECRKNFSRVYPESNGTCIAERCITANPPYFEFYTCGKSMVILFDSPRGNMQHEFVTLQRKLERFGYSTYDLS